ncbi:MAG: phosphoenolpyruvate--protein phosphotransferase [Deltaproteobacteria bacterium]|nr:MAG: phosphoenolpyruvate--protein phosphotransferase [Deltaproteobacteria bacterium]
MASASAELPQETILIGIGASPGVAIARSHLLNRDRVGGIERRILPAEVDAEIAGFQAAVARSRAQLLEVKEQAADHHAEHLYIIDTHLLILEDQLLINATVDLIRAELLNAEGALGRTLRRLRQVFDSISDEYLRERRSDIDSVGDRLMRNLLGEVRENLEALSGQAIIVAHDLSPADTMQLDRGKVVGFVTDVGGRTSHTAILARSLVIPAVVGLENVTTQVASGAPMIIDGTTGTVILNPSPETFRDYLARKQRYDYLERELLVYQTLPAETEDGHVVALRGNVELPADIATARSHGVEGIGLFRTEFLFMAASEPPSEEEQYLAYRTAAEAMAPHPVTIRTLDVGGDKFVPELNLLDEANPVMGLRAVRFSLKEGVLFRTQLRAILRAAAHGNVRVMFPMISGVAEIRACRNLLEKVRQELAAEGVPTGPLAVGIMVETPAAVLIADIMAREVDFFSVGTNDLIQYCLAIDRGNEHVAYLYEPLHPAVLRALQRVCSAARDAGIEVSICGEMAGEQLYSLVLIGLGFSELSMNPASIPRVKRLMRQATLDSARRLVERLLTLPTAAEVVAELEAEMRRRFPQIFDEGQI